RWGLSLGVGQPEDRIFAAVGDANAEGRYSDAADLIVASGWETDRVLLELVRADKGRGGIAEAEQTFARLLADADEDADPQYLSRLLCMDYRLTDPNAPEELRVEWVRDLLSTPADTGRV
ncbi:helix-turn-helix transcriptional regulator, partial [Burkholderia multivorans]